MYLAGDVLSCLPVAVQEVVRNRGYVGMSPAVAVQVLWDIVKRMFTIMQILVCLVRCIVYALYMVVLSLVAVSAVVQCQWYVKILLAVAVQTLWNIARCILTVVHCNTGICMSGVVSCLCTVHGCTIAGGCVCGCTVPVVCEDIAGSGCENAVGYCKVHVDSSSP